MATRHQTQSIETDAEPATVVAYLANGANLPAWAPGFADRVTGDADAGWVVTKGDNTFPVQIPVSYSSGTVDYVREIAPGRTGGACLRAVPRLGGGTVLVMTLPVPPGTDPAEVAAVLTDELATVVKLVAEAD
jgi:hypothetical protein